MPQPTTECPCGIHPSACDYHKSMPLIVLKRATGNCIGCGMPDVELSGGACDECWRNR